jgi:mannose/fructose/N-acetylgalactosamine-specific phosphotransferase system component IID
MKELLKVILVRAQKENRIAVQKASVLLENNHEWNVNRSMETDWVWWCTSVIPALRRLRKEDEFKARLGYKARQR